MAFIVIVFIFLNEYTLCDTNLYAFSMFTFRDISVQSFAS